MGFWHTGYFEHHPIDDLEGWQPPPPSYPCNSCDAVFDSAERLRRHRFEAHPTTQPTLYIRNVQIGNSPIRITRALRIDEIQIAACTSGEFNGSSVEHRDIPRLLSAVADDRIKLVLTNDHLSAQFDIEVRIAKEEDLDVVDASFRTLVEGRNLDRRAIDEFLQRCSTCGTAGFYRGGVAEYLYGVLSLERCDDIQIPFERYLERFNEAAALLEDYERPLARLIRSLIAFHFNHFSEAASEAPSFAIGNAARWFDAVLHDCKPDHQPIPRGAGDFADLLADDEARFIMRLAGGSPQELAKSRPEIVDRLGAECSNLARLKLSLLLLEASRAANDLQGTIQAARSLLSYAESKPLAERVLEHYLTAQNHEGDNIGTP